MQIDTQKRPGSRTSVAPHEALSVSASDEDVGHRRSPPAVVTLLILLGGWPPWEYRSPIGGGAIHYLRRWELSERGDAQWRGRSSRSSARSSSTWSVTGTS